MLPTHSGISASARRTISRENTSTSSPSAKLSAGSAFAALMISTKSSIPYSAWPRKWGLFARPAEQVNSGVYDHAAGGPGAAKYRAGRRLVKPHFLGQAFRITRPTLAGPGEPDDSADRMQAVDGLCRRNLQVMPWPGFMKRGCLGIAAGLFLGFVQWDAVFAGAIRIAGPVMSRPARTFFMFREQSCR